MKNRNGIKIGGMEMKAEKYAGQVTKYLKCSGGRKKEIKKQITSDIQAAVEEGSPLEQVIRDMGEPKELAAEFNESFSEAEQKAARRSKRGKIIAAVLIALGALALLVWWALPKMKYLSDSKIFSEEQVRERAEQILVMFHVEDESGMRTYHSEPMSEIMTQENMAQMKLFIGDEWGEMNNIGNSYLIEISQMGKKYAMIQMTVSYKNVSVTYTMTFDRDMKLAGFYLK